MVCYAPSAGLMGDDAFCRLVASKDEQIRRLVQRMAAMQQQAAAHKLDHAREVQEAVQKHARADRRADQLGTELRRATDENHMLRDENQVLRVSVN